jgi:hypothetical protein
VHQQSHLTSLSDFLASASASSHFLEAEAASRVISQVRWSASAL